MGLALVKNERDTKFGGVAVRAHQSSVAPYPVRSFATNPTVSWGRLARLPFSVLNRFRVIAIVRERVRHWRE